MKQILSLLLFLLLSAAASAQPAAGCCSRSATQAFAMFAAEEDFRSSHLPPLPYTYDRGVGQMVTFQTPDGQTGSAFEIRAKNKSDKYLLVFQEWWGLNDYIRKEAASYHQSLDDVNVLALDLYDGKVATTPEEAGKLVQSVKEERIRAIIRGAMGYAGKGAKFATIGWCFGGGWALQASIMAGNTGTGTVMYYGMPETDVYKLKQLNGPVLGIFAKQDQRITPEVAQQFEENMKKAGKEVTVKLYDAGHAFANPSNPHYHKEFTAQARTISVQFLRQCFK